MARIFLTGATGYIGGDVLALLAKSHPDYVIRALVRDGSKAGLVAAISDKVEVVEGDLDSVDIIASEAAAADVVLHLAATGHIKSVEAIHKGLRERVSKTQKPVHWVQISGASALSAAEIADKSRVPGTASDVVFDDLDEPEKIRQIVQDHPSRAVDNYVLKIAEETPVIRTALIFGPIIYGEGSGPVKQRSVQIPELAKVTLQRGRGVQVGSGLSRWGNVHIHDIGRLVLLLVEKALGESPADDAWGREGIYLAGVDELSFGEISKRVVEAARDLGILQTSDIDEVNYDEANELLPHGTILFGTNARGSARKAREVLGWRPTEHDINVEIRRVVEAEAKGLGLK